MKPSNLRHGMALLLAGVATTLPLVAADGDLDPTFYFGNGVATWGGGTDDIEVADAVALPDGTLIGVGTHDTTTELPALHWQAFDRDGYQLNRHCTVAPSTVLPVSSTSNGLTAIIDSTGNLLVGGWAKFPLSGDGHRPMLARFDLGQAGCVRDTSFSGDGLYVVPSAALGNLCTSADDCSVIDLAEIRPETGAVSAPLLVALVEAGYTDTISRYYLVGLSTSGTLQTSFGVGGSREVTAGGLGYTVAGGFARIDVDGAGRIEAIVSRFDQKALTDLDPVVLRFTGGGDLDTSWEANGVRVLSDEDATDEWPLDLAILPDARSAYATQPEVSAFGAFCEWSRYTSDEPSASEGGFLADLREMKLAGERSGSLIVVVDHLLADRIEVRRLPPSGTVFDASFGNAGVTKLDLDFGGGNWQETARVLLSAGRVVIAGSADESADVRLGFLARLTNAYVFADGFEWGTVASWSGQSGLVLP